MAAEPIVADAGQPVTAADVDRRAAPPSGGLTDVAALLVLAIAEAGALLAAIRLGGGLPFCLALHGAGLGVGAWFLRGRQTRGGDITFLALGWLGALPLGPLGFAGGAFLAWSHSRGSAQANPLVQQWYDRIALSTDVAPDERLYEDVDVGRTLDVAAPPPNSFPATMAYGCLNEQQAVLGQIARDFHLGFLETLKIALASGEPVVRVQAAAVAAHVSPRIRRAMRDCTEAASRLPADPAEALRLYRDLSALLGSGLLDATESRLASALTPRLGDTVIEAARRRPLSFVDQGDAAQGATLSQALEGLFISRGQFAMLRSQRTADRLRARYPGIRLRRLAVDGPLPEGRSA